MFEEARAPDHEWSGCHDEGPLRGLSLGHSGAMWLDFARLRPRRRSLLCQISLNRLRFPT
jgi:hypothetical protein